MINFNKTKYNKKDGFTLVETLVALFIFSVSVITTMSVVSGGIANTNYAKNKVISEYLAQEGIEYVKNLRDSSVLYTTDTQTGWNDFIKKLNIYNDKINWNATIDKEVYSPNKGIRMFGSRKVTNGIDVGHVYELIGCIDFNGNKYMNKLDNIELLKKLSIIYC